MHSQSSPGTPWHPSSRGWHWGLAAPGGSSLVEQSRELGQEPVSMAGKCDTIYKGFAGCLLSLGDSMAQSVRQSWDEFHACASEVLSSCPEEAAAIWESLRQESRKIQFQGNLQELCSARGRLASAHGSPPAETNQATLRGSAPRPSPGLLALLALGLLVPRL
uniref:Neuritin 1 like n=1 Tax=Otus sunia TaxID=257818 RepID=A0A8C8ADX8_9STRI